MATTPGLAVVRGTLYIVGSRPYFTYDTTLISELAVFVGSFDTCRIPVRTVLVIYNADNTHCFGKHSGV